MQPQAQVRSRPGLFSSRTSEHVNGWVSGLARKRLSVAAKGSKRDPMALIAYAVPMNESQRGRVDAEAQSRSFLETTRKRRGECTVHGALAMSLKSMLGLPSPSAGRGGRHLLLLIRDYGTTAHAGCPAISSNITVSVGIARLTNACALDARRADATAATWFATARERLRPVADRLQTASSERRPRPGPWPVRESRRQGAR